ncbi:MAG TPA: DUF1428 family protein [Candidatus Paceibacterota bacterium]
MTKGNYVDGFVLVIPKKNIAKYKKMATEGSKVWGEWCQVCSVENMPY